MHYANFVMKAKELTIAQDEDMELWYLDPEWVDILHRAGLGNLEDLDDCFITDWLDVEDILKLEVKRRNIRQLNKLKAVTDWFYDLVTNVVDPAMLEEETDYVKAVTEFMRANHEQNNIINEDDLTSTVDENAEAKE